MTSFVWGRSPQEAYRNPYEHEANRQFAKEAEKLLKKILAFLMRHNMHFTKSDESLSKAEWMLLTDSVDALIEALMLLNEGRHRVSARLFRDVVENIDLLALFRSNTEKSTKLLKAWFHGKFIPHRESRDYLREMEGEDARKSRAKYYQELSQFTHRTYGALCDSYSLGRGQKMVYDLHTESRMLVLPQTTSAYYAVIADLIIQVSKSCSLSELVTEKELRDCWKEILKAPSVPRRFAEQ